MNKQTIMILGGGFIMALLVAIMMQSMLGQSSKPQILNEEPKTAVLVATRHLKIGNNLVSKDMQWQEWPQSSVFDGAITKDSLENPNDVLPLAGRLRRNIAEGEPLMHSALVREEKGNFVAATLGKGMRAMAIKVKAESSVGGFVTPGDYVDVIMTYDIRLPSDEKIRDAAISVISKKAAQTVLENIRVVAVDQEAKEIEETAIARTVTLEVSPKQSERLALANAMGALSLTLRQLGDEEVIGQTQKTATTDIRMSEVAQELLGNDPSSGSSRMVRIYNGTQASDVLVKPYRGQ